MTELELLFPEQRGQLRASPDDYRWTREPVVQAGRPLQQRSRTMQDPQDPRAALGGEKTGAWADPPAAQ